MKNDDDTKLEGRLGELARDYNRPPPTPREEIWAEIEASLADPERRPDDEVVSLDRRRERKRRRGPGRRAWIGLAAAAAAVLLVGIGIGRWSAASDPAGGTAPVAHAPPSAGVPGPAEETPIRVAAAGHLTETESLLTLLRADAPSGRVDRDLARWGRSLLTETRLLLDSSAADDPAMARLLEDLEIILAQVTLLAGSESMDAGRSRAELELIESGIEEQDVMGRIQTMLPATD